MVNSGEFVMAAAVVVEKLERRSAVGAKKDSRRPRMSELWGWCGGGSNVAKTFDCYDMMVSVHRAAVQMGHFRFDSLRLILSIPLQ